MNKIYLRDIIGMIATGIIGLFFFQLFLLLMGIYGNLTKKQKKILRPKTKKKIYKFSCLWVFKIKQHVFFYKVLVVWVYILFLFNFLFYMLYIFTNSELFDSFSQKGLLVSAYSAWIIIIYNYVIMKFNRNSD